MHFIQLHIAVLCYELIFAFHFQKLRHNHLMKWTDVGQLARNFLIWKRNTESLSKMEKQISQEKKKSPALLIWSEHNQCLELQFSQKQKIVIPKANKREHVNWSRCHVMAGHFSPYFFPIWSAWIKPNYKYWYHHAAKAIRQTFWFKLNKRDYFMFRIITNKKRDDGERTVWFSERKWAHREPFM